MCNKPHNTYTATLISLQPAPTCLVYFSLKYIKYISNKIFNYLMEQTIFLHESLVRSNIYCTSKLRLIKALLQFILGSK